MKDNKSNDKINGNFARLVWQHSFKYFSMLEVSLASEDHHKIQAIGSIDHILISVNNLD